MLAAPDHRPELLSTYPSTAQSVHIRATDTTVRHSHINICLLPRLGLELLPDHLALGRLRVEAHPAFELVIGGSHGEF